MDINDVVGSVQMAELLDLKKTRVDELVASGVLHPEGNPRQFKVKESVNSYIRYLRQRIDPTREDRQSMELKRTQADVVYKTARAEKARLELAELEGQMHRTEDVEAATNQLVYTVRSMMLALPGRLAVDVAAANTAPEASKIIKDEITSMLDELTRFEYDPAVYAEMVKEREKWMNGGGSKESNT